MTVIISGTDGVSDVDGTAGTPALRGTDANTGIFFGADQVGVATNGVERVEFGNSETVFNDGGADVDFRVEGDTDANLLFVDASADRVGIGTNAPDALLTVDGIASFGAGAAATPSIAAAGDLNTGIFFPTADTIAFAEGGAEAMRIDSSGNLLVGCTSLPGGGTTGTAFQIGASISGMCTWTNRSSTTANSDHAYFYNPNGIVGFIRTSASATSYSTSSDYRLKEAITPMQGALARVAALKPVTYKWKVDGSDGEGFIAHELQAVVPDCVTGEKDAAETYTDENGVEQTRPVYQGIDTSFLVATLTAAIQEQQALITALTTRITALEAQ